MTSENDDFYTTVERMRAAQKEYFSTRDGTVLARSKELEREVDRLLVERDQLGLFGGEE